MNLPRSRSLRIVRRFPSALVSLRTGIPLLVSGALLLPLPVEAQVGGDGFLFRRPSVTVALRGGYTVAQASGGIYEFVTDELTLERSDFNALALASDLGIRLSDRFDLVAGVGFSRAGDRSEFRDYVDQDDLPIEQETRLTRLPLTLSARYYLKPRGRSIGRYAWIPADLVPYIGAGGGSTYYRFSQEGDFVDFRDLRVFSSRLESSGWATTGQLFAGLEYTLGRQSALTVEARYLWASSDLDFDFDGYAIDLAGFQPTIGFAFRF